MIEYRRKETILASKFDGTLPSVPKPLITTDQLSTEYIKQGTDYVPVVIVNRNQGLIAFIGDYIIEGHLGNYSVMSQRNFEHYYTEL